MIHRMAARSGDSSFAKTHPASVMSKSVLFCGCAFFLFAVALTIRTYTPCPVSDESDFITQIARGATIYDWHWLWSEFNGHRLAFTRLLVWTDLTFFGGKSRSLFVELYLVQAAHWLMISWVIERLPPFSASLKRTLQGLFGFCLFHPNQAQNLTWAFQVSFLLCFAIGTGCILLVVFFDQIQNPTARKVSVAVLAIAPLLAALNLAGGLLIAPFVLWLSAIRKIPGRLICLLTVAYVLSIGGYCYGWRSPDAHAPLAALKHPAEVAGYVLSYFDLSWRFFLPVRLHLASGFSFAALAMICLRVRWRKQDAAFEQFCLAECFLMIATALLTALGRMQLPLEEAGRYQTPAMLYWACLFSAVLVLIWRSRPAVFRFAEGALLLLVLVNSFTLPAFWSAWAGGGDQRNAACLAVMSGRYQPTDLEALRMNWQFPEFGAPMLRKVWK